MKTIAILLIEDNSSDARLIKEMLKEINLFKSNLIAVETLRDGCEQIKKNNFDIILLDLNLPDSTGQQTLEKVSDCYKEVPIVLITGNEDEELSLKMIKGGAQDYITKQSLNPVLLGKSILYSIERKNTEINLLESEKKYHTMVTQSPDSIFIIDLSGTFLSVNKSMCDILKYTEEEFLTMKIWEIVPEQYQSPHKQRLLANMKGESLNSIAEYDVKGKDGIVHAIEVRSAPFYKGKELIGFQGTAHDITEQKKAEKDLKESEQRFRELYQNAKIGLYRTTPDGTILMANIELVKMLGYSSFEKLAERNLEEHGFEPSYKRKEFTDKIEKYGEIDDLESTWTCLDGSTIFVRESTRAIRDSQGKTLYYDGVVEDITERKQAVESIRQYREQLEFALNGTNDGIWDVKMDTGSVYISPRGCEILGYNPEDFHKNINQWNQMVHPEDLPSTNAALTAYLEGKTPIFIVEERLRTFTGDYKWILTRGKAVSYDSNGKALRMVGTHTDISEQKQVENALISSKTHLRILVQTIPDLIWTKDADGIYLSCNAMFERLFGAKEADIIGKTDYDFVDRELADFFRQNDQNAITAGKPTSNEEWVTFADDGHRAYLETIKAPMHDAQNRIIGVLGIGRDITDRKEAIDEIRKKNTFIQTVLDNIPIGIALNKIDSGSAFYVNKKFEEIYGWPEDEMKDMASFFEKVYPDKKYREELFAKVNDDIQSADKTRMHWENCIITHKDGTTHTINAVNIPLFDQNTMVSTVSDITERKLAESQLRDSEEKYRTFFENSMDAILLTSPDGNTLSANEAACSMFGYTKEELINLSRSGIVDTSDRRLSVLLAERKLKGKAHGEITLIKKDGTHFPAEISTAVFVNAEGYERTSMIIHDISERKNAEKEITMLAQSLRSVNELVTITDIENKILFANDSFLKTYGYLLDELIGENISLIQSKKNVRKQIDEILPSTILGEWRGELINTRKDGTEFPIYLSTSIINDKDGKLLGLIGVATDITERRRNEQTLMKLSSAVEQTVDLIVITDRNGTIEYINRAFEELTGYSSEEVMGKTPRILKSGAKNQEYYEGLWKTILSGKVFRAEMLNKKKNGDLYYEEKSISPILDKNNIITHFVSTGLDTTKRKLAEKELITAKEKAEENDKLKTAFLQNMSHEIRTPMNAIVGFSELMELEIDEPEKLKYYTKIIRQRSDDLLGIINDLLDISRIEAGQLILKPVQADLNKLFEELRSLFSVHNLQIEKSSINLKVKEIPSTFNSIVSTDVGKLKQIFSNLIHNAFKFTSEGKIEFGFHSINNNKITFFVTDSGSGISESMKDLIFERFRKSADESVYVQDGMGLGLAIVKGLLKLFDGKIRVESELNLGSTFFFTIPYLPIAVKKEAEMPVKNQKHDWSKSTLLIVEDDKFNIAYFKEVLEATGIKLLIGETGNQAISLFTNNQNIDLVLMDIKLPDMNGFDVTKEIKKINPNIPVIAQTAYASESDKEKALETGCDDLISKPIKAQILISTISKYI